MNISKELLSKVLGINITHASMCKGDNDLFFVEEKGGRYINIYELIHKNLKEWAKLKSVFDIIDWSEEPEQIFKKAEDLRNEIN